ncbi:MAG TPA: RagB/SusD family nutrient uptake outer membrane protein, partial [Flavobacteriaceae bacterium]|nr:RagB/SusD family nutrient uptake outer membrane protein [Flavobacteriaceae bacterium]
FTYSYAWAGDAKAIDANLYNAIPSNDVRKGQFYPRVGSYYDLMPINKFYNDAREIGGQRTILDDYVYMRVAEMYLLSAEMSAKEGMTIDAQNRLKDLLAQRFENATDYSYVNGLIGQDLIDEVYLQTRIELWGEGKAYLALKRNQETVVRGDNHLALVGESILYNDERLTFVIPQQETLNNPNIN